MKGKKGGKFLIFWNLMLKNSFKNVWEFKLNFKKIKKKSARNSVVMLPPDLGRSEIGRHRENSLTDCFSAPKETTVNIISGSFSLGSYLFQHRKLTLT